MDISSDVLSCIEDSIRRFKIDIKHSRLHKHFHFFVISQISQIITFFVEACEGSWVEIIVVVDWHFSIEKLCYEQNLLT